MNLTHLDNTPERTPRPPQTSATWEADVIVPFVQNLLGGAACGALRYIWLISVDPPRPTADLITQALIFATVAIAFATIVRFFSDDLGIITGAFKAGRASAQIEINRLKAQIAALDAAGRKPTTAATAPPSMRTPLIDAMDRSRHNAIKLIEMGIQHRHAISRRAAHQLTEREWEAAVYLLDEAQLYHIKTGQWTTDNQQSACATLNAYYQPHYTRAVSNSTYRPPWLGRVKS